MSCSALASTPRTASTSSNRVWKQLFAANPFRSPLHPLGHRQERPAVNGYIAERDGQLNGSSLFSSVIFSRRRRLRALMSTA